MFRLPYSTTHTPTRPHLDSRLNSVVTIRSHRLSNSSAHAYPLRNRSSVCVVQLPYHRGLLRLRSGSIPLQGFSSGWPLSIFPVPYHVNYLFIFGHFSHRLFPYWATHMPPTLGLVCVGRSYSLKPLGCNPAFKRAVRLFDIPLLPCSLTRFRDHLSTRHTLRGIYCRYGICFMASCSPCGPFGVNRAKWKGGFWVAVCMVRHTRPEVFQLVKFQSA